MIGISSTFISNLALSYCGSQSRISSLDEVRSPNASECKLWFDLSLQTSLEGYNWSFAKRQQTLALSADAPPPNWGFRYLWPGDCLAPRVIVDPLIYVGGQVDPRNMLNQANAKAIPFDLLTSIDGSATTIVTNMDQAVLEYTFYQKNMNMYSPLFVAATACVLAGNISFKLTGKDQSKVQIDRYWSLVRLAQATDANKQVQNEPSDADHIVARQ